MKEVNFEKGDVVFHKSNPKIKMVVVIVSENIITCRFVTDTSEVKKVEFFREELFDDEKSQRNKEKLFDTWEKLTKK